MRFHFFYLPNLFIHVLHKNLPSVHYVTNIMQKSWDPGTKKTEGNRSILVTFIFYGVQISNKQDK